MKLSRRTLQILTLTLLAIIAVGIPTLRRIAPTDSPTGGHLILRAMSPAIRVIGWLDERVTGVFTGIHSLATAHRRAEQLEEQAAELRRELSELQEAMRDMGEWPALVAMAESVGFETVAVRVIARSPSATHRTVIIDAGTDEGVVIGVPIVNSHGLVGTVSEAAPHTAVVRLVMGENIHVTARVTDGSYPGVIVGTGEYGRLEFIPEDQGGHFREGMEVVTAGLENSIYPPGIPIGTITEVINTPSGLRQANVQPTVDFRRLNQLLAVVGRPHRIRPLEGRDLMGPEELTVAESASLEFGSASPELVAGEMASFEIEAASPGALITDTVSEEVAP